MRARIAASLRPVIVHSALSGITDRLESLLAAAAAGTHVGALGEIDARHRDLARALGCVWADAREVLRADTRPGATRKAGLLSATCDFAPDSTLQGQWRALEQVVITQGFIASNRAGETVLRAAADRTPRARILRPS